MHSPQCGLSVRCYRLWQPRLFLEHKFAQLLEIPKRVMLTSSQDRAYTQSLSQLVSFFCYPRTDISMHMLHKVVWSCRLSTRSNTSIDILSMWCVFSGHCNVFTQKPLIKTALYVDIMCRLRLKAKPLGSRSWEALTDFASSVYFSMEFIVCSNGA